MNVGANRAREIRSPRVGSPLLGLDSESPNSPRRSQKCCLSGCIGMASTTVSPSHRRVQTNCHHRSEQELEQQISRLEKQVGELEKEVLKQKELRMLYRKRAERTQDYLKHCLQIAQEKGFLQMIMNPKDTTQPYVQLSPNSYNGSPVTINGSFSPQLTTPEMHSRQNHHSDLALIMEQARVNGWLIENPHEVELKEKIAEGSTSAIFKATWRGLDVAVKCISPEFFNSNPNGASFFAQELETLSRQRHRFVLHLMAASFQPPNHAWVVTELLSTTLRDWLHGPGNGRRVRVGTAPLPPLEERVARAVEISQAMQYLHEQKPMVIHRDLKPSNVLLDDSMHVRVADFGHARFLGDQELALTGEIGTYVYMAPEVIRCEPYNEKCDVYSFGVILNELITGDHPFIEKSDYGPPKIGMEVAEGKLRPAVPEDKDGQLGELIDLICLSWDQNPSIRPPFSEITLRIRNFQQKLTVKLGH